MRREFCWLTSPASPLSMYMRRDATGKLLGWSSLRVRLELCFWLFVVSVVLHYEWTPTAGWVFVSIPGLLVLDTLCAMIPIPELLGAVKALATAGIGWASSKLGQVTSEVTSTLSTVKTSTAGPADVAPPAPEPVAAPAEEAPPHEWAAGDPHAGLG